MEYHLRISPDNQQQRIADFVNLVPAKNSLFTTLHIWWNVVRNMLTTINFYAMLASGSDLRIMRGLVVVDSRFNLNLS
ncbi:hypothetical protein FHD46_15780 [Escherichia coli]|nr:hypothetical protein C1192_14515 [Escherichia marmotae]EEV6995887.1 hypothetical protein [Escherichia coli]PSS38594.1 hypothetical protein BEM40_021440 [Escherichia sp. MOD1-EC5451]PSY61714.1 hypothetical protein C7B16_20785 [Escherichia sp. 20412-1]EFA4953407.1 hypothetical protein [Escherichia coli]